MTELEITDLASLQRAKKALKEDLRLQEIRLQTHLVVAKNKLSPLNKLFNLWGDDNDEKENSGLGSLLTKGAGLGGLWLAFKLIYTYLGSELAISAAKFGVNFLGEKLGDSKLGEFFKNLFQKKENESSVVNTDETI